MDKVQVVDYSQLHLQLKAGVDAIWRAILEQRFSDARAMCDEMVVQSRLLKAQIAVQHPKETGHDPR
jgi:hypothetical protein